MIQPHTSKLSATYKSAIVGLVLLAVLSGCDQPDVSRLDAEEAGYVQNFSSKPLVSAQCRAIVESVNDWRKYHTLQDNAAMQQMVNAMHSQIQDLRKVAEELLPKHAVALPPPSFAELHQKRIAFLEFMKGVGINPASEVLNQINDKCLAFYLFAKGVDERIQARAPQKPPGGTIKLSYQPPILPVSVDSEGVFTVKQTISTPVGNVTVAHTNSTGVKLLIIRADGKERYFSLQKEFEVFIPSDYGVRVSGDGKDTLTIEVVHRASSG